MKSRIPRSLFSILIAILLTAALCFWHRTQIELRMARASYPDGWSPDTGWPIGDTPHFVTVGDHFVLVGNLSLRDGTSVAFWFISHHQTDDYGGTLFELPDGKTVFIEGYFCCDVSFDPQDPALANTEALLRMLNEVDGRSP